MKRALSEKRRHMEQQGAPSTPADLQPDAVKAIAERLNTLLADVFVLYLKTKNYHWHVSGPHFRDYHKLLDKQAGEILAMVDPIAERVRKLGAQTLKSFDQMARLRRMDEDDAEQVDAQQMLATLCEDNRRLLGHLRQSHEVCEEHGDLGSTGLIEDWIDQTEERAWFLAEIIR